MTKTIRNLVMAVVVAAGAAGAAASPALAADWGHGRDGRVQEWRHADWRGYHGYAAYPAPYVYAYGAPAYGYYAPPPVAAYAPPVLSFSLGIPVR